MHELLPIFGAAIPSVLIALALRRWFVVIRWSTVAIALALPALFLAAGMFGHRVPVPVDEVVRGYPYRGIVGEVHVGNPLTNDTVKQILPWMQLVREQFWSFRWPLWNRYQFSGYPLLANGQSAPFSPFFLLTLFVSLPKQLVAMAFLKLFCAFVFGYLFLRDEGRSNGAALFGAALFTFSVFETVYLYYPLTSVTALLPLLLWSLRRAVRSEDVRWAALFCVSLIAAVAGGHPESVVHLAIAAGSLLGVDLVTGNRDLRRPQVWTRLAFATAAAVCFSAPAWLPVLEQVRLSQRINEIVAAQHAATFPIASAWLALNPNAFGHPSRGSWNWFMNYSVAAPSYVGLLALALGVSGFASRERRVILFLLIAVVLFLVSMNWTAIGHLINAVPPFSLCANDRVRFVCVFLLAIAGAYVLDNRQRFTIMVFIPAAVVLCVGASWLFAKKFGQTLTHRDLVGVAMLLLFLVGTIILWRRGRQDIVPYLAFGCAFVELFTFNTEFNVPVSERYYRLPLPIVERIRQIAPSEPFRIVGFDWVLMPNAAAQYGLEDIRGSDPMEFARYGRFFKVIEFPQSDDVKRIQDIEQPGVAFLNVRFALTEPGFGGRPGWERRYASIDGELYESTTALRRFFVPLHYSGGPPTLARLKSIRSFTNEVIVDGLASASQLSGARLGNIRQNKAGTQFTFSVDGQSQSFVASSQPLTPGWHVRINGHWTHVYTVNGAFIGFMVPPGHAEVLVCYEPRSFNLGLVACVLTVLTCSLGMRRLQHSHTMTRRESSDRESR